MRSVGGLVVWQFKLVCSSALDMLKHFELSHRLQHQAQSVQLRQLTTIKHGVTPTISMAGKKYVNFASNDYLGLASAPQVVAAFCEALQTAGQVGSGASHLVSGHHIWHDELAATLAQTTGYPTALTFSTGYMANIAVLQALCDKDSVIFSDRLNHASIVDGALLSRATLVRFAHRDYAALERRLASTDAKQKLIVTDHVFSMDGTCADLVHLHDLAQRYEAALVVDDAHGFGLPYQAAALADIYVGTLGKAIGTMGAFVAGEQTLIDYLVNVARPFIYTTAQPPALAKATLTAIQIARTDNARQQQLQANIFQLRTGLREQGWQVGLASDTSTSWQTAIVPVIVGDNTRALQLADHLRQAGIWATAIRPPTVPVGTARLRFCVSAAHSADDIAALLDTMAHLRGA